MALPETPLTRVEQYLAKTAGQDVALPNVPLTRLEQYLAKIAGQDVKIPDVPLTRKEQYLAEIAKNGGGSSVEVVPLPVINNGTYIAPSGKAYSPVNVTIPQPSGTKNITITANGTKTENVKNYVNASITVDVPSENPNSYSVITGTLSNPWGSDGSPSELANLLSQRNATAFLRMTIPNAGSYILPVALDEWGSPSVFVVSVLMYSPAAEQTTPNGGCILYSVADGSLISAYMYVNGTLTDVSTQMAQLPTELRIITHPLES